MNKPIRTYEDLLNEQQRLLSVIKAQEDIIRKDIAEVQKNLEPYAKVATQINRVATRDNSAPLLNAGLEFGVDILLRKFLLVKSGWLTKIIIPYLVKNYSSHIIGEEKRTALLQKVHNFLQKIRRHATPEPHEFSESGQAEAPSNQKDFSSAPEQLNTEEKIIVQ